MLFSNAQIADLINREFEPAWQSVRPAAIVRVDFGNGQTITRTLNGNVATYVCNAEGTVLDVIPGVYEPATYLERLKQAVLLHRWAGEQRARLAAFLENYHREQAAALRQHSEPKVIVEVPDRPLSIIRVESGLKLVLKSSLRGGAAGRLSAGHSPSRRTSRIETAPVSISYDLPPDLASRMGRLRPEMLADDTRHNESVRRVKVHDYLANHASVRPSDMTKWLYREVLHTDLDDPHLGLGKLLFATYPFEDEDDADE